MRLALLLVFASMVILACSEQESEGRLTEAAQRVLKVAVSADGTISLDGHVVSLPDLRDELANAAGVDAAVWYYREQGQGEPPEQASLVIQAIIENRLPVSLSSEPDYSTVVMPDGSAQPRRQAPAN